MKYCVYNGVLFLEVQIFKKLNLYLKKSFIEYTEKKN